MSHDDGGSATEQIDAMELPDLFESVDTAEVTDASDDEATIDVADLTVDSVEVTGSGIDDPERIAIDVLVELADRGGRYRTTATFDIEDRTATLVTVAGEGTFGLQVIATREAERRVATHDQVSAVVGLENYLESHPDG